MSWPYTLSTTTKTTATVYAHWKQIPADTAKATVIYLPGEGGNGSKSDTVDGGKEYTILSSTEAGITGPDGKVFSHWECTVNPDAGLETDAKFFGSDTITPKGNSTWIFTVIWKDDDSQTGDATYTVD